MQFTGKILYPKGEALGQRRCWNGPKQKPSIPGPSGGSGGESDEEKDVAERQTEEETNTALASR